MIIRIFVSLIFISTLLSAHQTALSYLELKTHTDNSIEVIIKKPLQDINGDDLKIEFPRKCSDILPIKKYDEKKFIITKRVLSCGEEGLTGSMIRINNLLQSDKGVIFKDGDKTKLITAYEPYVLIQKTVHQNSFFAYFRLGVEHILSGIDHLLFVLALLLIVPNIKVLIQTITAFTVAHSITLGFATLGFLKFSVPYTEAMIALSIVFLARELLVKRDVKTLSYTHPWIIAFVFGLLHGLGFASALFEVGLPAENIISSLLFFNIGVEFGQLMFIFAVLSIIWLFSKWTTLYHQFFKKLTAYLIGITASYWFIERSLVLF